MRKITDFFKKHPYLLLAGVVIVILVVVLTVVTVRRLYSGSLRIVVAPTTAEIMIDGKKYQNGLYEGMKIGTVQAKIAAEGFESESFDLDLAAGETTKLYLCLKTDNPELLQTEDYVEACALVKEYYGEREKEEFWQKYPIANDIPIVVEKYSQNYTNYIYYRIDLGEYENCEGAICLKITDISGGNYERALQTMRDKGYNPDDYEIIYEDATRTGHAG